MVAGLSFLLLRIPGELFAVDVSGPWSPLATPAACAQLAHNYVGVGDPPEKYLYVSIGSGVSILEVHSDGVDGVSRHRRVGGSSVGGSTFWGLVRLLTSCSTFDEVATPPPAAMLPAAPEPSSKSASHARSSTRRGGRFLECSQVIRLTESGSSANVDMLVGDIYGGDCAAIGLKSEVIAASFGKVSMQREERAIGLGFLIRYLRALARHYEEGFWLILLAVLNFIPVRHRMLSLSVWGARARVRCSASAAGGQSTRASLWTGAVR